LGFPGSRHHGPAGRSRLHRTFCAGAPPHGAVWQRGQHTGQCLVAAGDHPPLRMLVAFVFGLQVTTLAMLVPFLHGFQQMSIEQAGLLSRS
jgi:hypothetical protein